MTLAANLVVEMSANTSKLKQGFDKAENQAKSAGIRIAKGLATAFGVGLAAAGVGIGVLVTNLKSAAQEIDELGARAETFGLLAGQMQKLEYIAKQTDVEISSVGQSLTFMKRTLGDAAVGTKSGTDALAKLGLTIKDFAGKDSLQSFELIAQKIRGLNGALQENAAFDIFGKGGLQSLKLAKADVEGLSAEFDALGVTISASQQAAANDADNAWNKTKATLDGIWQQGFLNAAPAFSEVNKLIGELINNWGGVSEVALQVSQVTVAGISAMVTALRALSATIDGIKSGFSSIGEGGNGIISGVLNNIANSPAAQQIPALKKWAQEASDNSFLTAQNIGANAPSAVSNTTKLLNDSQASLQQMRADLANGSFRSVNVASQALQGANVQKVELTVNMEPGLMIKWSESEQNKNGIVKTSKQLMGNEASYVAGKAIALGVL